MKDPALKFSYEILKTLNGTRELIQHVKRFDINARIQTGRKRRIYTRRLKNVFVTEKVVSGDTVSQIVRNKRSSKRARDL